MLTIENVEIFGYKAAIRGMRNPMNSWSKSDSNADLIGQNDEQLMLALAKAPEERKYLRMIHVQFDVTAPLYWWKEFDTYKIGTVANSCSTMHKIHAKEFTLEDFSHEHLIDAEDFRMDNFESMIYEDGQETERPRIYFSSPLDDLKDTIAKLNLCRRLYLDESIKADRKIYWWQMIQLLPSSYNQRRTIDLNFEVLLKQYRERKNHKLDEWHIYCDWIKEITLLNEIIKKYGY